MKEYWIIKDKSGNIAVNRIYESEEDARFEFVAHPQYFNSYDTYDVDDFEFVELTER